MKKITFAAITLLLLISFVFSGCGGAEKGESGGVLIFARSGDSVGLDPGRETDGESFYIADNVFETLVEFKPGTTEVQPCLAKSWTVSDDGLEFVFKLEENVKFHDGTDFNADAVVFSIERQFKKDHPFNNLGPWQYWGYMDMDNIIESVEAVDAYTVKFTLKRKEAPFVANLAMNFAAIVSPAAVEKSGEDFRSNPVGTGPFKFVSWQKDDNIVLERNDDYWREKAYLDRLIFKVIPDATARYLALKKGEVDIIDFPSPEDLEDVNSNPDIKVIQQAGLNVGYLAMNCDTEHFADVRVRQAVNYAIDKGETGTAATNPIPPGMWSYNKSLKGYKTNIEKAKKLLAEAGYPDGFDTNIWAMPVSRPYNPNGRKVAEIMQAQLAKVGINAEIVSYDWGIYLDKTADGEHEMALLGWTGDNGDPDNFLNVLLSSTAAEKPAGNISFWRNEEFTDLIAKAKEDSNYSSRVKYYKKAQVIFEKECPWVPIAHSLVTEPMKKTVMGFVLYPTGKRVFRKVWIKK